MAIQRIIKELIPMGTPSEFKPPVPPVSKRFTVSQKETMVNNYWQDGEEKRAFIILHAWLRDLYDASAIGEVALRVSNIENKDLVDAKWVSYPGDTDPTITNDLRQNPSVKYYVLKRKFYDDATPNGEYRIGRSKNTDGISAQIGMKGTEFFVVFSAVKITYKKKSDGGIGNGGSANAALLPPPKPPS
jgi:hypothetical protein